MSDEIIARRLYTLTGAADADVAVEIARPVPDQSDYRCDYTIHWPGAQERGHATGVDEIQALLLALRKVAIDLRLSEYAKSGRLSWLGNRDNLGLP